MLKRLVIVLLAAGCSPSIVCHCPFAPSGPGWCQQQPPPANGGCACPSAELCPGYCLPDGGEFIAVRCDAGP